MCRRPESATVRATRPAGRSQCRADVLRVLRASDGPQTRKELFRTLRACGARHGAGTLAKSLADLVRAGELLNPKDKQGYRLSDANVTELQNAVCPTHGCKLWYSALRWIHCPACLTAPAKPESTGGVSVPVVACVAFA